MLIDLFKKKNKEEENTKTKSSAYGQNRENGRKFKIWNCRDNFNKFIKYRKH